MCSNFKFLSEVFKYVIHKAPIVYISGMSNTVNCKGVVCADDTTSYTVDDVATLQSEIQSNLINLED